MARIRSIHPDACKSRKLASVSGDAERCYWRLATHCDDHGRCEDEPRLIWAALFPLHDCDEHDVDRWLWELADAGLILRYEQGDRHYLAVARWGDYQHPQKPRASELPDPSDTSTVTVRECPTAHVGDVGEPAGHGPIRVHVPDRYGNRTVGVSAGEGVGVGGETEKEAEQEGESEGEPFTDSSPAK